MSVGRDQGDDGLNEAELYRAIMELLQQLNDGSGDVKAW